MSNEELMMPRYKVIADYPFSPFMIGAIIHHNGEAISDLAKNIHLYPYLFKKLEWWEERQVNDMPKYVKMNCYIKPCTDNHENIELKKGQIFIPEKWGLNSFEIGHWVFSVKLIEPSTEEEYLSSLTQLESTNK